MTTDARTITLEFTLMEVSWPALAIMYGWSADYLEAMFAFVADGGDPHGIAVVEEHFGVKWDEPEEYVLAAP